MCGGIPSCATDAILQSTVSQTVHFRRPPRRRKSRTRAQRDGSHAGITTESKDAIITSRVTATTNSANVHMFVDSAEAPNPCTGAVGVEKATINSLNVDELRKGLQTHPDRHFVNMILEYAQQGVPLGYAGPRHTRCHDSWPSAYKYIDVVLRSISQDIQLGRKMGPYPQPPEFMRNYIASPLGAFPKKHSKDKYRIVHDLSWPPGRSVNHGICAEDCRLKYISLDDITQIVRSMGHKALLSK